MSGFRAAPYAKALFSVAADARAADAMIPDLEKIAECLRVVPDFHQVMVTPMVAPERLMPGVIARPCTSPINRASTGFSSAIPRVLLRASRVAKRMAPVTQSMPPTIRSEPNRASNVSCRTFTTRKA